MIIPLDSKLLNELLYLTEWMINKAKREDNNYS